MEPDVNTLPFHPWWHHPNSSYVGKHRGTYQFGPKGTALPYGVQDVILTPYLEDRSIGKLSQRLSGFKPIGFMLPKSQTIEFTSEQFAPLTGDDKTIRLSGKRDWNISMTVENIDPQVFSMMFGEDQCMQQSRFKAMLSSVVRPVVKFWRKVTRHSS